MKVYLSGPMTGIPNCNRELFRLTAETLREQGMKVVDPSENFQGHTSLPRATYMRLDLARLLECHAIVLLPGWEESVGARLEAMTAADIDLPFLDGLGVPLEGGQASLNLNIDNGRGRLESSGV